MSRSTLMTAHPTIADTGGKGSKRLTDKYRSLLVAACLVALIGLPAGCKRRALTQDSSALPEPPAAEKEAPPASYGKVPPYFTRNAGQLDKAVRYYVKGPRGTVYITESETVFDLMREKALEETEEEEVTEEEPGRPGRDLEKKKVYDRLVFRFKLKGSNPEPDIKGEKELPGKINYFIGSQSNWHSNIPTFEEVLCRGVYDGIDVEYYFEGGNIKYSFILEPGADPGKIVIAYEGIDELKIKPSGELVVVTRFGGFVDKSPRITQAIDGKEVERKGKYKLLDDTSYTYDISAYDSKFPLLIK